MLKRVVKSACAFINSTRRAVVTNGYSESQGSLTVKEAGT